MSSSTERFSDRRLKQTMDGNWTAQRGFDVVGYTDDNDCIEAIGVNRGDPHPLNSDLTCVDIFIAEDKLTLAKVIAMYEVTSLQPNPSNPINRQPIVLWKRAKSSEDFDTDMNGNPILNSAQDVPKTHFKRNYSYRYLTITRWEPYYDQNAADEYVDTVTSTAFSFEGVEVDPGQAYCANIAPTGQYQEGCKWLEISYEFEIRTPTASAGSLTDLQKRHPFQLRFLDCGTRAQYDASDDGSGDDKFGQLYLADGNAVTSDVHLDGDGTPIDDGIKVTAGGLDADSQDLPDGVLTDTIQDDDGNDIAVFLIYMKYGETDFTQIGLPSNN